MKTIHSILIFAFLFLYTQVRAGEGMWLPHLLAALNQDEMQAMGMKMTAEDIYSVNQGSLKDAIVHFGGFCTGEVISNKGLVLTNHHCGYSQIQSHTSIENNLLRDGFWAKNHEEELSNPGLFVRFIDRIEDVTEQIMAGVNDEMSSAERQSQIDKNLNELNNSYPKKKYEDIIVRPFFKGNQYILFVTKDYKDIRLVGAPPESIGKYGHDTDNWVWPRHTGDFSMFRIYAGPDGEPADYSEENVPFEPAHSLPISLDGVEEGDFTLVFGFPGRTDEYLPGKAVDITANHINPARIGIRESAMKVMDAAMKSDESIKIQYASKFARLTNYWKKWIGESTGLKKTHALKKKSDYERKFTMRLDKNEELNNQYKNVLPELNALYDELAPYMIAQSVHSEAFSRNIEIISLSNIVQRALNIYNNNGEEAYLQALPRYKNYLEGQIKNFDINVDVGVMKVLMADYLKYMPEQFVSPDIRTAIENFSANASGQQTHGSISMDPHRMIDMLDKPKELDAAFTIDPVRQFIKEINENYDTQVSQKMSALDARREELMRQYMKAQMEAFPDKEFYPDANSTMRVTYGNVMGYQPRDAVYYEPVTYLEGAMEKYEPGDWEFDLPQRLIDLYEQKDYGQYSDEGKLPICFIGTNHTTGGNSGSPAIDAHGNLIGLNFDRAWEGTMSDLNYDASICRNIMVDVRYILFVVDKYAGATNIIEELNIVHPKR